MEEEIIENPSTLCRICLSAGNYELTSFMTIDNDKVVIEYMLKQFSLTENGDNIPAMLCSDCLVELSDSYKFLRKVQRADEYIKQLFFADPLDGLENKLSAATATEKPILDEHSLANDLGLIDEDTAEELKFVSPILQDEYPDPELAQNFVNFESEELVHQQKAIKRNARGSKKPMIVLTENVSNILSRVLKPSVDDLIDSTSEDLIAEDEPPNKKSKLTENKSLIITKYVLRPFLANYSGGQSTSSHGQDTNRELRGDQDDPENSSGIHPNNIQTISMETVEVDANTKIFADEIDDVTNIEDPNCVYMCKYCPKAFSTSHHLLMHSRKSHICHFCTKSFVKVTDLHSHTREAHKSFKCMLCNEKEFSSNSNLRNHIKKVHDIDLPAYVSLLSVKLKDERYQGKK